MVDNFSLEEQSVVDHIEEYAAKGYRTLAFGYKQLPSAEIEGVYSQNEIESCLILLGATCVEDLLQQDVRQCLEDFKTARIKAWMLTGDKGKTAKMIGVQCGMLTPLERSLNNNKATRTEFEYQQDGESLENQEDVSQKANLDVRKVVR